MKLTELQEEIKEGKRFYSPALSERIMTNTMTLMDIDFVERGLVVTAATQIHEDATMLYPVLTEGVMRIMDLKAQGDTEVDLDYTLNLINDMTDFIMMLKDLTGNISLEDVEPKG